MRKSNYATYFDKGSDNGDCTCVMKFRLHNDARRTVEKPLGKSIEDLQQWPLGEPIEISHHRGEKRHPFWGKVEKF